MNDPDELGEALAKALGVDTSPGQHVSRVELTLAGSEQPRLVVTRWVTERGVIGAVERVTEEYLRPPRAEIAMLQQDVRVLEVAVREAADALDNLVGACLDAEGRPKAPDRGALMRVRAMLPPRCQFALKGSK